MDQGTRSLIKRHNEYAREQVVRDLDALGEKLNVKRQVRDAAHNAVDKAKGTLGMKHEGQTDGVGGFVKTNLVPLLAIGAGGALLARNVSHQTGTTRVATGPRRTDTYPADYAERSRSWDKRYDNDYDGETGSGRVGAVTDKLGSAKSGVSDKLGSATDKASDLKDSALGKVSGSKDAVLRKVPSRGQAVHAAKDNAPVMGLAAMAAGVLAGAFVPRTRFEEEKLAPVQEQVIDNARHAVEDTVDRAKGALQTGVDAVSDEFKDEDTSDETTATTPNRITGSTLGTTVGTGGGSNGLNSGY